MILLMRYRTLGDSGLLVSVVGLGKLVPPPPA
jgi:hypothetical protein